MLNYRYVNAIQNGCILQIQTFNPPHQRLPPILIMNGGKEENMGLFSKKPIS